MKSIFRMILLSGVLMSFATCSKNPDDSSINIFSIEDDKQLGAQVNAEIQSNPQEFPILSRTQYAASYEYLYKIRDRILNSGKVFYKDEFVWEFYIIEDDSTLNAFATPGGYIYVYTGLIKYLQAEDQLAGVLAHEVAHADRRHSTDQLTKAYGLSAMIQVALGNDPGLLTEIAASLLSLSFSRSAESEADDYSVTYLCPTVYEADGAADFFSLLEQGGASGGTPEFLSTHPDPGNRIVKIEERADALNCEGTGTFVSEYQAFQNSLP